MANKKKASRQNVVADKQPGSEQQDTQTSVTRVRSRNFRKAAKEEIENKYQLIVQELGKKACEGSIQHTKVLFELGGVEEEVEAASKKRRKRSSLSQLLLKEAENARRTAQKSSDSSKQDKPEINQ